MYEYGTKDSYQQIQLDYFHRILYGNSVYSGLVSRQIHAALVNEPYKLSPIFKQLELDGFSEWILRNVLYSDLDTFFLDKIRDHEEELKVQDRRQKHISDIARNEDEQEILKLLLQKINVTKELTVQTGELFSIDTENLSERSNSQKSLYLSAKLRAKVSEDLYGLHLSMLTFVELSKEEKHIFEFSKQTSDSQTNRTERMQLFESYLRKTKDLHILSLADNEQNMAILTYKSSRAQDKVKEKNDLENFIKIIQRYKSEDKEEMSRTNTMIEKINSEIKNAKEQYQLLQNGVDELNENQISALEILERQQLAM